MREIKTNKKRLIRQTEMKRHREGKERNKER